MTSPLCQIYLIISKLLLYHTYHPFAASKISHRICGGTWKSVSILVLNLWSHVPSHWCPFFSNIDIMVVKHFPPTLELSHIITENLKPIPMHHFKNTFLHQCSIKIHTYKYLYLKTRLLHVEYSISEAQMWTSLFGIGLFAVALLEHDGSSRLLFPMNP